MELEKLIFNGTLTLLVAFITAALGLIKLIADKESKVGEYRQAWTTSVRSALAELIGALQWMVSLQKQGRYAVKLAAEYAKTHGGDNAIEYKRKLAADNLNAVRDKRMGARISIYDKFALVSLHFKPGDPDFKKIEGAFKAAMTTINSVHIVKTTDDEFSSQMKTVDQQVEQITESARVTLKETWETIKRGEPAYIWTRRIASLALGLFLAGLLFSIYAAATKLEPTSVTHQIDGLGSNPKPAASSPTLARPSSSPSLKRSARQP